MDSKTTAERQRNLAISRQLAARAATVADDGSLARLLVSALATRYSHSPEADSSLAKALIPTVPLARALWSPSRADSIECLSFHRNGASRRQQYTHGVTVWRLDTGQVEAFLSADDGVDCVVFGPRDDLVAISDEGRVILWEWREGRTRTLGGELNHETTRSAFSADGRSVLVASLGQVMRWDIDRATSEVVISQPGGSIDTPLRRCDTHRRRGREPANHDLESANGAASDRVAGAARRGDGHRLLR